MVNVLSKAAKKAAKQAFKKNPTAGNVSFSNLPGGGIPTRGISSENNVYSNAYENIKRGLNSNFKGVDDSVLNLQTERIMKNIGNDTITDFANDRTLFGRMARTNIGENAPSIESWTTSATGSRGWLGKSETHASNFGDNLVATEVRGMKKMENLNREASARDQRRLREDDFAKMEFDNKQAITQHLREEGFSPKATKRTVDRISEESEKNGSFIGRSDDDKKNAIDTLYRRRGEAIAGEGASEGKIDRATRTARREESRRKRDSSSESPDSSSDSYSPSSNKVDAYMQKKYGSMVEDIESAFNSGQELNADAISAFSRQTRLGSEASEKFGELVEKGKNSEALSLLKSQRQNYVSSANMMDKAVAHKIPQKGAVVVGGAWLLNNMSTSRGQQSNAELYGQQTPYM